MIVKNEEFNIKEALGSVKGWADEIVIVDDESNDRTVSIIKEYTHKIFARKMDLEGKQRNYAVSRTINDWVMWLDADERMTTELQKEINDVLSKNTGETVAYWIPRKNYIGDYWLRYGGWYPAPHIKLYNKNFVKWKEVPYDVVHPGIEIAEGFRGATLKNHLIHYGFKNIENFVTKVNRQSTLEAIKWHIQGKKLGLIHGLWKGLERFGKGYICKRGYKDGYYGLVAAVLSGFYQFAAYSKLKEIEKRGIYVDLKECQTPTFKNRESVNLHP